MLRIPASTWRRAPKVPDRQLSTQPKSSAVIEADFFVEVVRLAKKYGFMVIHDFAYADVAFEGYVPAQLFGGANGAKGCRRRIHDDEQGLQHGRMASRILCAGNAEMVRGLRHH